MFLPYGTDAPVYHWPKATVALIVANTAIFLGTRGMSEEAIKPYLLAIGHGIHPLQWLTSVFLHGDFEHLFGNMLVLWVFGIVVEGKVGALAFLAIYLGIGAAESAAQQFAFLGAEEQYSLGASAAIYGLMAICLVWAPKNDINVFVFMVLFYRVIARTIDIPIMLFALAYIGLEVFFVVVTKASLSSALSHSTGALLGFGLGVFLLKTNLVDCENWDLFAVTQRRSGRTRAEDVKYRTGSRIAPEPPKPRDRKKARPSKKKGPDPASLEDPARAATRRLRLALEQDGPDVAFVVYNKAVRSVAGWKPCRTVMSAMGANSA